MRYRGSNSVVFVQLLLMASALLLTACAEDINTGMLEAQSKTGDGDGSGIVIIPGDTFDNEGPPPPPPPPGEKETAEAFSIGMGVTIHDLQANSAGEYFLVGYDDARNADLTQRQGLIAKLDNKGQVLWAKIMDRNGTGAIAYGYFLQSMPLLDGGAIAVGYHITGETDRRGLVFRFGKDGQVVWSRLFNNIGNWDRMYSVTRHPSDSNVFYVGGGHVRTNHNTHSAYLVQMDINGNLIWQKTFGDAGVEFLYNIEFGPDGHLYAQGFKAAAGQGPARNFMLAKLTPNGQLVWTQTYGTPTHSEQLLDMAFSPDGHIYAVGSRVPSGGSSQNTGLLKIKVSDGALVQYREFGTNQAFQSFTSINMTESGGLILSGAVTDYDEYRRSAFMVLDAAGSVTHSKVFESQWGGYYGKKNTLVYSDSIVTATIRRTAQTGVNAEEVLLKKMNMDFKNDNLCSELATHAVSEVLNASVTQTPYQFAILNSAVAVNPSGVSIKDLTTTSSDWCMSN